MTWLTYIVCKTLQPKFFVFFPLQREIAFLLKWKRTFLISDSRLTLKKENLKKENINRIYTLTFPQYYTEEVTVYIRDPESMI